MSWRDHLDVGKQSTFHIYKILVALVAGVFVARALGPENLGILALVYAVCFVLSPCISLGCGLNLLKEVRQIKEPNKQQYLLWALVANKLTYKLGWLTLSILLLILIGIQILGIEGNWSLAILCLVCYLLGVTLELKGTSTTLIVTNLKEKLKRDCVGATICSSIKVASTFLITPEQIILGSFLANLGESIFLRFSNLQLSRPIATNSTNPEIEKNDPDQKIEQQIKQKSRSLFKEGMHLLPTTLITEVSETIKKFTLAFSHSPLTQSIGENREDAGKKIVGEYSIAQRQAVLLTLTGQTLYERFAGATPLKIAAIYTLGAAIITALTLPLIPILYGPEFKDAMVTGAILLVPNSLTIIAQCLTAIMVSLSLTKKASKIRIASTMTTLIICPVLIPLLSIVGLALAVIIGETICILWTYLTIKRQKVLPETAKKLI